MDVKVEPGLGDSRGRGRGSSAHGGVKRQRPWEAAPGVPGNVEPRESAASGIVVGVRGRGGRNRGPSAAAAGDIGPNSSGQRGRAATKGKGKGKGRRNRSDSDAQPDDADTRVRDEAQAAVRKLVMAPLSTPLHVLESTDVAVLKVCAPCMYAAAWASTPAQHVRGTLPATSAEGGTHRRRRHRWCACQLHGALERQGSAYPLPGAHGGGLSIPPKRPVSQSDGACIPGVPGCSAALLSHCTELTTRVALPPDAV